MGISLQWVFGLAMINPSERVTLELSGQNTFCISAGTDFLDFTMVDYNGAFSGSFNGPAD